MSFEKMLALHCAPALAGIKPASLFAMQGGREGAKQKAAELSRGRSGVSVRPVDISERTTLFFVYNRESLSETLRLKDKAQFIEERGYPPAAPLDSCVSCLCARLRESAGQPSAFPHEIGVFLGYPLEDVEGFIASGGRGFKLCGHWKVYGDVARARAIFNIYAECRRLCLLKACAGYSALELAAAMQDTIQEVL